MPTQGFGLSQMIQHRKQGTGFVMELEEKLANRLPGGADIWAFQFCRNSVLSLITEQHPKYSS